MICPDARSYNFGDMIILMEGGGPSINGRVAMAESFEWF